MSLLKLQSTQQAFYASIFEPSPCAIPFIRSNHASQRFYIYRQNIFENLRRALSLSYPGVWILLGKACADSAVDVFCAHASNRPQSACLDDWGDAFPEFLGAQPELQHLPYLQDYAIYEKLQHQAYYAEENPASKSTALQALHRYISENPLASICFSFLAAVHMFCSDFPLQDIQAIVDNPEAPAIPLTQNKSYVIITKSEYQCSNQIQVQNPVLSFWVSADLWFFLRDLKQGCTLKQAADQTQKQFPNFDLAQALHFAFQNPLFHQIHFSENFYAESNGTLS